MKVLKRIFLGLSLIVGLILTLAVVLPYAYKDSIRKSIDDAIAENINADVVYNSQNFEFSLFRHFPNFSASTGEIGIFNRKPFEGEHLFVAENLRIEINLWDLIFGTEVSIKGITLIAPDINIKTLEDGRANYDITFPASDATPSDSVSNFSFSIDSWQITRGRIKYYDATFPFGFSIVNLEHSGSGDFNEKLFDLRTSSSADSLLVTYDGTTYVSDKHVDADAVVEISEDYSRFTFKDNLIHINEFGFGFNGWFKMNPENYEMDISWSTESNSLKNLLSLIPDGLMKDKNMISATGNVQFAGYFKGLFDDNHIPAFQLAVKVKDGSFKYPEFPESVSDVNFDLQIDHNDGPFTNTRIDLKSMRAKIGINPIDARLLIENLINYPVDAHVSASIDLASLSRVLPFPGLTVKGKFDLKATAKGIYDSVKHVMPMVEAKMKLSRGYLKKSDVPIAAEQIDASLLVNNETGKMEDFKFNLTELKMMLGKDAIQASISLKNLNDYSWDALVKGGLDLGTFSGLFPIEGTTIKGKLLLDLRSSGKYSDLTAGRYERLPASGSVILNSFTYASRDFTLPVEIPAAELAIDSKELDLKRFEAILGNSDFKGSGFLRNYIGFISGKNDLLNGELKMTSKFINLNDFMSQSDVTDTDTASFTVIPVPANMNLNLSLSASAIKFMDFNIAQATGTVLLKEGQAKLESCKFSLLDGAFSLDGAYDPRQINKPLYDFDLSVDNLSIREAANSFSLVKKFAPVAGLANGKFSLGFKISGAMDSHLSPVAETVNASGVVEIKNASVTGSKAISALTGLTKLKDTDQIALKDVKISASIKDGQLSLKPFDMNLGDIKTTVSGSSTLSGKLDYVFKLNVPSDRAGAAMTGILAQAGVKPGSTIPLNILLGGTFSNPKPSLLSSEDKKQIETAVKSGLEEKGKAVLKEATQSTEAKTIMKKLNLQDTAKADSAGAKVQVQQLLENKLKGLLRKKKN